MAGIDGTPGAGATMDRVRHRRVHHIRVRRIGTTNPVDPLQVAGAIGAEEVIVSSTGADYVFAPTYQLKPLTEINRFIQEHHHLPDIPSAAEAKVTGVNLGEMQTKLLAKIEELTLHMIELQKQNDELRQKVERIAQRDSQ